MPPAAGGNGSPFLDLLEGWNGMGVVTRHDRPSGAWFFIALHDDTLGPPVGGCRMRSYRHPAAAARDAMRLAEGMTAKWAALDLPFGGGKAVIAVDGTPRGEERRGILRRFGELLDSLDGLYGTGEDLGTTPEDMAYLAGVTRHVIGIAEGDEAPRDPGPFTALGVFAGIRAALEARTGAPDLTDRTVAVQGVGDVGGPLAGMLAEAGARVVVSDVDPDRARDVATRTGGRVVAPDDVYGVECDVFAPCAVGGVLNADTIPRLRCGIVAGSANNQLEKREDAGRLGDRGVLYAPDYVINGGGAMAFGLIHLGETDTGELRRRVESIGATLAELFAESAERGESPLAASERRVDRILARGKVPGATRG